MVGSRALATILEWIGLRPPPEAGSPAGQVIEEIEHHEREVKQHLVERVEEATGNGTTLRDLMDEMDQEEVQRAQRIAEGRWELYSRGRNGDTGGDSKQR